MESHLRREWRPGDHASVTAPTGYGKSFLVVEGLLPLWDYTITVDVKGDDPTVAGAGRRIRAYPSRLDLMREDGHRFVVAPGGLGEDARRRLDEMFRKVWASSKGRGAGGTWVLYLDEARVLADQMKLKAHLTTLYVMGRSRGITLIGSTQAPRFVFSEFFDQPRWHFLGRVRDRRTLRRMSEIGGDTDLLMDVLPSLDEDRHEFLVLGPNDYAARTVFHRPPRRRAAPAGPSRGFAEWQQRRH